MKILAIRGRDIASLRGDFQLALDQPPLDQAGLFTITGPTGSGKSTILDAMCLALFNETPRTSQAGRVRAGQADVDMAHRITAQDPRTLLRRGAGSGYAEVDFRASDGKVWRARWQVRRARGRASGRLQQQEISLTQLDDGTVFAGKQGEVLHQIRKLVGLDFSQFRRSVLLAQGDFAAFLRANEAERASLLERMSDTVIYSQLSRAAFEHARGQSALLKEITDRHAAIPVLDPPQRRAAEEQLTTQQAALQTHQAALKAAERDVQWYATLDKLRQATDAARTQLDQARQARDDAQPAREELAQVESVQDLREVVGLARQAQARLQQLQASATTQRQALELAGQAHTQAHAQLDEAQAHQQAVEAAHAALAPQIERARVLDTLVERATQRVEQTASQAKNAALARDQATQDATATQTHLDQATRQQDTALAWLRAHDGLEPLAQDWARWSQDLQQLDALRQRVRAAQTQQDEALQQREAAEQHAEELQADLIRTAEQLQLANTALDTALAQDPPRDVRDIQQQLDQVRERLRALTQAPALAAEAASLLDDARQAQRRAEQTEADAAEAEQRSQALQAQRVQLQASLEHLQASRDRARLEASLSEHRAALSDGQPCPLCGAPHHPFARQGAADDQAVSALDEQLQGLQRDLTRIGADEQDASAHARAEQVRAQAERRRQADRQAMADARLQAWRQLLGAPAGATPEQLQPQLDAERDSLHEAEQALVTEASQAHAHAQRLETLSARSRSARTAHDSADTDHREAARLAEQAATRHVDAIHQLDLVQQQTRSLSAPLEQVLAPTSWGLQTPLDTITRGVQAWLDQQALARQAASDREQLAPAAATAQARAEAATKAAQQAAMALDEAQTEHQQVRSQRAALLDGKTVSQIQAQLSTQARAAAEQVEAARRHDSQAAQTLAASQAAHRAAAGALTDGQQAASQATATRDAQMTERGLSLARVDQLLAHDQAWRAAQRAQLAALDNAVTTSLTLITERQAQLQTHQADSPPAAPAPQAAERLTLARAALDTTLEALAQAQAVIQRDDQAQRTRAAIDAEAAEQRTLTEVANKLSQTIGSADGRKFRIFAQSLTLNALLQRANQHLRKLTPRYQVQRVPGQDLDLQIVDHDLGDAVRPVTSLSGGESFLVSLALALGLASLSARSTRVETLFIDEGFGTLDGTSLELALDTLQQLHAQGRQVAIISHVDGLAARIGYQVQVRPHGGGASTLLPAITL